MSSGICGAFGNTCKSESFTCSSDTSFIEGGTMSVSNNTFSTDEGEINLIASLLSLKCLNNDGSQAETMTYSPQGTTDATTKSMHNCKNGIQEMIYWGKGVDNDTSGGTATELEGVSGVQFVCLGESQPSAVLGSEKNTDGTVLQKKILSCKNGQIIRGFSAKYLSELDRKYVLIDKLIV